MNSQYWGTHASPYIEVPQYLGMDTWTPKYMGMHPHIAGDPSTWGCIPNYWGRPRSGDASQYTGEPQHIGMHPPILGHPVIGRCIPPMWGCISTYWGAHMYMGIHPHILEHSLPRLLSNIVWNSQFPGNVQCHGESAESSGIPMSWEISFYIYRHTYIYMYNYEYKSLSLYIYMYLHIHIYIYMHTYLHMYV